MLKSTAIHYLFCDGEECPAQIGPITATSGTNARRVANDTEGWVNSRGKDHCPGCVAKRNAGISGGQLGRRIINGELVSTN